jgi:hypothetical protein
VRDASICARAFAKDNSIMPHSSIPSPVSWTRVLGAAAACIMVVAPPVCAHHAFSAEFDADKPIELSGTVTKIKWVNPHSWLYFDVKAADGTVTNWGVEFGAPSQLARIGLTKVDVTPGTQVRVTGFLAKNGGPYGYSVIITLPDGRSFKTGGAADAPANRAANSGKEA